MEKTLTVGLAGNANVGKSSVFNQLTGLTQVIGNWPGKTVEKAEGTVRFAGYEIHIVDLPGIYSLSTYTIEEIISREYIAIERPDVVINVVDATALERNLFFTLQLLELGRPVVIALNQVDLAKRKGIEIDVDELEDALGVPVVPTVATKGKGLVELLSRVLDVKDGRVKAKGRILEFRPPLESRIKKLIPLIELIEKEYPARWISVKMLEGDEDIVNRITEKNERGAHGASILREEIESIFRESSSQVIASERYLQIGKILENCQKIGPPEKPGWAERLDDVTTHRIWGYPIMAGVLFSIFAIIFFIGDLLSALLGEALGGLETPVKDVLGGGAAADFVWSGVVQGIVAGVTIALPYLIPFFIFLAVLEGSGYLARVAFLMDGAMHRMGLHGKAFIPLMLGYGCNVPACLGCRVMDTHRERLVAIFAVTLVPCAAVTVVILGTVGAYVGIGWALLLYLFNLLIIFLLGRIAFKAIPGEPVGLIMEMPAYRKPDPKVVVHQTWARLREFIVIAFPFIIVGSKILEGLRIAGTLTLMEDILSPITVGWLGLPAAAGVVLVFGILRKEMTLVMFAVLLQAPGGVIDFSTVMNPVQMIVFALVVMFYIPCVATLAVLWREIGWKRTAIIIIVEAWLAVLIGGVAFRVLDLIVF